MELEVVPELGAKIISLKDLRSGREWLWHPPHGRKLFRNRPGDDFFRSPLVGIDECFPTIAPCVWEGRNLPDHGELWSLPWTVDDAAWSAGILKTTAVPELSPFEFTRIIKLDQNVVRSGVPLDQLLVPNRRVYVGDPSLCCGLQPGDHLDLPGATRALFNGEGPWVDGYRLRRPKKSLRQNLRRRRWMKVAGCYPQSPDRRPAPDRMGPGGK